MWYLGMILNKKYRQEALDVFSIHPWIPKIKSGDNLMLDIVHLCHYVCIYINLPLSVLAINRTKVLIL